MDPAKVQLPQMTDVHHLFNPAIAPPSLVATKTVITGNTGLPGSAGNTVRGMSGIFKRKSQKNIISGPTNFRHIVHIGSDRVEIFDESLTGGDRKKQEMEVDLVKKNGGFGMNIKTLDNGRTMVSLVAPNGAAESLGIQLNDEITHVDDAPIEGLKHEDVIAKIRGKNSAHLKLIRYVPLSIGPAPSPAGAAPPPEPESADNMGCRVCGSPASFNCSSCGPHVTYCSVECQKKDWSTHKNECQSSKQQRKPDDDPNVPSTGSCRVCRAKNARFRCVCGKSMYCSQECQMQDWPNHKNNCTSQDQDSPKTVDTSKLAFFAVAEKWLSKMVFLNGVFECKWTVPLTSPDDKLPMYPTCHIAGGNIFVGYADRLASFDLDSGSQNWVVPLGYPFDGTAVSMVDFEDIVIVGGVGSVVAFEKRTGMEVWRKLLNRSFAPVTLLLRGSILFASSGEYSFCMVVDDDDAALAWRSTVSTSSGPKPLSLVEGAQNTSFLAVGSEKLQVLKAFDGQFDKNKAQPDTNLAVTISVKNDIFLVLRNGTLTRYNPKDLTSLWELKIPECETSEGTLLQNSIVFTSPPGEPASTTTSDVVYVGIGCRVLAVDAKTGESKWVAKLAKPEPGLNSTVSMILLGDDLIAATAGRLYALSGNSGNPLRKAQLPQKDNPTRFISIVAFDYSERTVSCVANLASLYARN